MTRALVPSPNWRPSQRQALKWASYSTTGRLFPHPVSTCRQSFTDFYRHISVGNQGTRVCRMSVEGSNSRCLEFTINLCSLTCCCCWWLVHCVISDVMSTQEISEHFIAHKFYGDADFLFQQDLASTHSAKSFAKWFTDHSITLLDRPANSPDWNPNEKQWDIVMRKMGNTWPKKQTSWRPLSKQPGL